ncbi:MAG: hypothetical protein EXS63_03320 [Candidatus Omnitrophica bacterium]|nr:hypothetical protein [Candidatus Omnitrophota bacterium]
MKISSFLSLALVSVMLSSMSCMDHLKTKIMGDTVITEGNFLPKGPFADRYHQAVPFYLLGFKSQKPGEKFPLLMLLHGSGDSAEHALETWQDQAQKARVMILAPSRTHPYKNQVEDLEALNFLADKITADYPVDTAQRTLAGASSGALMARQLAVLHPSGWKNLVLISSPPSEDWIEKIDPASFPAVLYAHGRQDPQFSYERIRVNGERLKERGVTVAVIDDPQAVHETRDEWIAPILRWIKTRRLRA